MVARGARGVKFGTYVIGTPIDRRTDIYSLGAVVYEMLTGEPPHTGGTVQAIVAKVLTERPRRVRVLRPSAPEYVEQAIDCALEKVPADRWPTAGAFADGLRGRARSARGSSADTLRTTQAAPSP